MPRVWRCDSCGDADERLSVLLDVSGLCNAVTPGPWRLLCLLLLRGSGLSAEADKSSRVTDRTPAVGPLPADAPLAHCGEVIANDPRIARETAREEHHP